MKDVALCSVLFNYPDHYQPVFYKNACNFFNEEDIYISRDSSAQIEGYYDKLFYYKIVNFAKYIEKNILNKYTYLIFLDATDTNFINSPIDIVDKFKLFNSNIVFGAEKGLWPPMQYNHLYESKNNQGDYKYLNSGMYIGYVNKIYFYLNHIIEKEEVVKDDQARWAAAYLLNDDIALDCNQEIFFSTYESKNSIKKIENKYNLLNSNACIVHDNGPYTENTLKLADLLNT